MDQTHWLKQTDRPLFPELEWSRPETRTQAGKLLIIGGNGYEFKAPANAYGDVLDAGVGAATVLLPNSMQRVVSDIFPEAQFAPSTISGSFASAALAPMLDLASWGDGVLLPGDISRNSETTVLLEHFLAKYQRQVTLTKDVADLFVQHPLPVLYRDNTLLVMAMGQLRRLASEAHYPQAFMSNMGLVQLVDNLCEFTKRFTPHIITRHQNNYIVAVRGQVSTTPTTAETPIWRLATASRAAVWWLQNPAKPFEALTTAVYEIARS